MKYRSILIIRSKQMVRQYASAVLYWYMMKWDCKAVAVLVEIDDLAYLRQTGNAWVVLRDHKGPGVNWGIWMILAKPAN